MEGLTQRVRVNLGARSYDIMIGPGVLGDEAAYAGLPDGGTCAIVTNETVGPLLEARLRQVLERRYSRVLTITLPDGESHKNWSTLNQIFDVLLAKACDRQTVLFALGGGVVGDMTGFAAACYMRGIDYVQVPTTLLAQVDSSVGGKTAINHPLGKNMVGAFLQPLRVVADVDALATLPLREVRAGLAEIIKIAAIADARFFEWLEAEFALVLAGDKPALVEAVKRSCELKAAIVQADERERGLRALLNFGHTFAHAIEAGTGFGTWLHGEAVGCGMVMAADLSARLGCCDPDVAHRVQALVRAAGLPSKGPALGVDRYLELMRVDKKAQAGKLRFVLPRHLGSGSVETIEEGPVTQTLEQFAG